LHIGETRYFPLDRLEGADKNLAPRLAANVEAYRARTTDIQKTLAAIVTTLPPDAIVDLPSVCASRGDVRLLRYPLLINDPRLYAALAQRLQDERLGVSHMYRVPLPKIAGLENLWDATNTHPNASEFASQLLTLPTHSRCDSRTLARLSSALRTR
jgi:dTDP-4-amino-4,6-dideoxygalactose transaminase